MLALITGTVHEVKAEHVTVVTGGIGFSIYSNPRTLAQLRHGQEVQLHTTLVGREDSLTLFGFLTADERDTHQKLQSVSGVGPRIALAALEVFTPDELRTALAHKDEAALQRIPGIGKKSAQRLIVNIGDKLGPATTLTTPALSATATDTANEVISALTSLGWPAPRAKEVVSTFAGSGLNTADMLRAALIALGGNHG